MSPLVPLQELDYIWIYAVIGFGTRSSVVADLWVNDMLGNQLYHVVVPVQPGGSQAFYLTLASLLILHLQHTNTHVLVPHASWEQIYAPVLLLSVPVSIVRVIFSKSNIHDE